MATPVIARPPATLPPDFFESQQGEAPPTLPHDFFDKQEQSAVPKQSTSAQSFSEKAKSVAGDFAKGAWSKLSPIQMLQGMADMAQAVHEHPIDTALSVLAHPYFALKRAKESYDAGKPEEAAAHLQSAFDPTGFATEGSAVKAATPGHRAEGFGELIGTGLQAYLGSKVPEVAAKGAKAATEGIAAHPTLTGGVGAGVGAMVGHGTGVPGAGFAGAYIGRELGKGLSEALRPAESATPPPLPADPLLDKIAQGFGVKSFSKLDAAGEETVRNLAAKMRIPPAPEPPPIPQPAVTQSSAPPPPISSAAPPPAPQPVSTMPAPVSSPVPAEAPPNLDASLANLRGKLEAKGLLKPGYHLGEEPHGSYAPRYDEGSAAPTVTSTAPKTKVLKSIPPSSPLANNPKALEAAKKMADQVDDWSK